MEQERPVDKELIMYGRSWPCPDQVRAERFLQANKITYRKVLIDQDPAASELVERYVGHRSVPTMMVAAVGSDQPVSEPAPIPAGRSTRSFDRGTLITEPSDEAMRNFLRKNGLFE